ncbi:fructose-specific PTS transporter subunit EIIC [Spiroplasma sp. DGKH1]|uniref:fructose-specific PTS transporter subunit EIIC n=1 Tax=Spiroplasma sp. DGKH1 TaxID=3050074 RepID=UPI0034C63275
MTIANYFHETTTIIKGTVKTKTAVFEELSALLVKNNIVTNQQQLLQDLEKREKEGVTGVGDGIAIPHCSSSAVNQPTIAIMTLATEIDWQSLDNKPVDLIFMIVTPAQGGKEHIQALSQLAMFLTNKDTIKQLRRATSYQELINAFQTKEAPEADKLAPNQHYDVIGITACPTGIAHTYMAKEKLEEAAKAMGYTVKIETQGRSGPESVLTPEDIANAKIIIFAADKAVTNLGRFANKEVLEVGTKDAIYDGQAVIKRYLNHDRLTTIKNKGASDEVGEISLKQFKYVSRNLLGGVSRMLPFVVAGGIILGIGFLLDSGYTGGAFGTNRPIARWFSGLGKIAFAMMIPILGAYVAYSIVGPQGLLPGMIAGLAATAPEMLYSPGQDPTKWVNEWGSLLPSGLQYNSGFIGALVGGYAAAFIVYGLTVIFKKIPQSLRGVKDIVFIPVLSVLAIGVVMFALNIPLGYFAYGLKLGVTKLNEYNVSVIVGLILGFMMCVDLGGPVNKVAYTLGTLSINPDVGQSGFVYEPTIMGSVMAAGMVPPLAIACSCLVFKKVWTPKDREASRANWFLALCFITEGAIPYAAKDPKRVLPAMMVGGAITGAVTMAFQVSLSAPHGGIFVFALLRSNLFSGTGLQIGMGIVFYLLAIILGAIASTCVLSFWRMHDIKKGKLNINL